MRAEINIVQANVIFQSSSNVCFVIEAGILIIRMYVYKISHVFYPKTEFCLVAVHAGKVNQIITLYRV